MRFAPSQAQDKLKPSFYCPIWGEQMTNPRYERGTCSVSNQVDRIVNPTPYPPQLLNNQLELAQLHHHKNQG